MDEWLDGWLNSLNEQIDGQMMGGYMNGLYCNVNSSVVLLTLSISFSSVVLLTLSILSGCLCHVNQRGR